MSGGGGANPRAETPGAVSAGRPVASFRRRGRGTRVRRIQSPSEKGAPVPPPRSSILERHGRLMARGRWIVIPLFLVLLVGAVMLAGRIGDVTTDE